MTDRKIPASMENVCQQVEKCLQGEDKLIRMFRKCYSNTYLTTMKELEDGSTYIITGDIPAMWLRDSAAQVRPYMCLVKDDPYMAKLMEGVIERHIKYINIDPYANAFNQIPNGACWEKDITETNDWLWERKYEIDSLCYPIQLAYLYWKATSETHIFNHDFKEAMLKIIGLWKVEQNHEDSPYSFIRLTGPSTDTLTCEGKGEPVRRTGMTWSGFRPSDDACTYGYLVPSNMFAVVVLQYLYEINQHVWQDESLGRRVHELKEDIQQGIREYGVYSHKDYGDIFAYETDGMGNYNFMDDANVPSLLSIPYLGYCEKNDPTYLNTRRFIRSKENPYFYKGEVAAGIGSPHTPSDYIWHISMAIEGLTAVTKEEQFQIIKKMAATDGGTDMMHEGFHVDDPSQFTRDWFSWANAMFCELILEYCGFYE